MNQENRIYVGRVVKLYPTKEQEEFLFRYLQLYRFVYNWGVNRENEQYEYFKDGKTDKSFLSDFDLMKEFGDELKNNPGLEWLQEEKFPVGTRRLALRDVTNSFRRFFSGQNNYPKFKSKRNTVQTFKTRKERCSIKDGRLRIEGLPGKDTIDIHTHVYDGFSGRPENNHNGFCDPSITFNGDYFYLSFGYLEDCIELDEEQTDVIGIDLGIRNTFTLSDGTFYHRPSTKKFENQIKRINRKLQKRYTKMLKEVERTKTKFVDIPKSNSCKKYERIQRKRYRHIANIKEDYCYKVAREIISRNPKAVCMEDIGIREIQRNHPYINKILHHEPFYKYRVIINHMCNKYSIPFILADRDFPSTKKCSVCGEKHEMGGKKVFKCPYCGYTEDRDINAAINLRNFGYDVLQLG